MAKIGIAKLRAHFEGKGFEVWTVAGVDRRVHTLDCRDKGKIVMSFRVEYECVGPNHIKEVVKRYANGLPAVNPYTGRP